MSITSAQSTNPFEYFVAQDPQMIMLAHEVSLWSQNVINEEVSPRGATSFKCGTP